MSAQWRTSDSTLDFSMLDTDTEQRKERNKRELVGVVQTYFIARGGGDSFSSSGCCFFKGEREDEMRRERERDRERVRQRETERQRNKERRRNSERGRERERGR